MDSRIAEMEPLKPCFHIRPFISPMLDQQLPAVIVWYIKRHTAGCAHCGATLDALTAIHSRLRQLQSETETGTTDHRVGTLAGLTPDRFALVEAAWDAMDTKRP